jgi:hypothetical protein
MAEPQPKTPPLNPEKIFPVSWDQFHRDSRALAWRLNGAGPFEAIVSITRGGLVPAAIVARELGIRLIETVCVASYDHTTQSEVKLIKGVAPAIIALGGGKGLGVLIVDDLVDTGQTAKIVRALLPRSMPSPWAGRWSTPSSPRCPRTPGSTFPGIPDWPFSRRFVKEGCRATRL